MTVGSRIGLGLLVLAALLVTLVVDTCPQKYRAGLMVFVALSFSACLIYSIW